VVSSHFIYFYIFYTKSFGGLFWPKRVAYCKIKILFYNKLFICFDDVHSS
jgi:hypothetical protein